jgi:F-type H+-transporting ATPase subunit b
MEYQAFHALPWQHGSFWVAVAIGIFVLLFGRKIFLPIAAMLDQRTLAVREALAEAARLKAEAEAMLRDATARQEQAMKDARQIVEMAHEEAARARAELTAEAHATAERRKQLALQRIAAAEKSAVNDVRLAAIDIATAAASATLRAGIGAGIEGAMIDQAIAGVPAALRQAV